MSRVVKVELSAMAPGDLMDAVEIVSENQHIRVPIVGRIVDASKYNGKKRRRGQVREKAKIEII